MHNTSLNLTRHVGASRLVARRLALRYTPRQAWLTYHIEYSHNMACGASKSTGGGVKKHRGAPTVFSTHI